MWQPTGKTKHQRKSLAPYHHTSTQSASAWSANKKKLDKNKDIKLTTRALQRPEAFRNTSQVPNSCRTVAVEPALRHGSGTPTPTPQGRAGRDKECSRERPDWREPPLRKPKHIPGDDAKTPQSYSSVRTKHASSARPVDTTCVLEVRLSCPGGRKARQNYILRQSDNRVCCPPNYIICTLDCDRCTRYQ